MKPLAIDLFCGLGGWTDGLLAEGPCRHAVVQRRAPHARQPRQFRFKVPRPKIRLRDDRENSAPALPAYRGDILSPSPGGSSMKNKGITRPTRVVRGHMAAIIQNHRARMRREAIETLEQRMADARCRRLTGREFEQRAQELEARERAERERMQ